MRGFTLIELVMIIVILGVLAVVVAPKLNLGGYRHTEVTTELVQAIRYTQFQSLYHTGSPPYEIAINGSGFIVRQGGNPVPDPYTRESNYARSWSNASISPTAVISFNGRGEPSCTPAVLCENSDLVFNITASGISSNVVMEHFTGFVH